MPDVGAVVIPPRRPRSGLELRLVVAVIDDRLVDEEDPVVVLRLKDVESRPSDTDLRQFVPHQTRLAVSAAVREDGLRQTDLRLRNEVYRIDSFVVTMANEPLLPGLERLQSQLASRALLALGLHLREETLGVLPDRLVELRGLIVRTDRLDGEAELMTSERLRRVTKLLPDHVERPRPRLPVLQNLVRVARRTLHPSFPEPARDRLDLLLGSLRNLVSVEIETLDGGRCNVRPPKRQCNSPSHRQSLLCCGFKPQSLSLPAIPSRPQCRLTRKQGL